MNGEMFAMLVLVGLLAGWLAGILIRKGGNGLLGDLSLGLGGSTLGGLIFQVLGASPGTEWFAMLVAAFAGAALVIIAQRKVWPGCA